MPGWVVDRIRTHVVDTIGCGIAGAESPLAAQIRRFVAAEHGAGPCALLGCGTAPRSGAALANAVAMNALDHDDGLELDGRGLGHPGATIVAAALAACGGRQVDGARFLLAVIAGYEVNARVILSMQPSMERFREVYGVCQHQAVGAAVAAGVIAGLDGPALENAIGLAGTLAPVPSLHCYNWQRRPLVSFKDFNGPAAAAGVAAVALHEAGMIGARDVLGAPSGLWRMLGSDRFDAELLTGALGETWWLARTSLKPYPACRWMHTALEAFDTLRAETETTPSQIEHIVVHAAAGLARDFMDRSPVSMIDAQFSLPYAIAMLALEEIPGAAWFGPGVRSEPAADAIAARVEAVVDPEIDALMTRHRRPAGRVTLEAGGRRWRSPLIEYPLGSPERPLDAGRVEAKALANIAGALGPSHAETVLERLTAIEAEPDIASLMESFRAVAQPHMVA